MQVIIPFMATIALVVCGDKESRVPENNEAGRNKTAPQAAEDKAGGGQRQANNTDVESESPQTGAIAYQSPIDIPANAETDAALKDKFHCEVAEAVSCVATNDGFAAKCNIQQHIEDQQVYCTLRDRKYHLTRIEFRWGRDDKEGSEHALQGKHYPLELQCIFRQPHDHGAFSEGKESGDEGHDEEQEEDNEEHEGDALLGYAFMYQIGEDSEADHVAFFAKNAPKRAVDDAVGLSLSIKEMTRAGNQTIGKADFCTAPGSMTTAPYKTGMQWVVAREVGKVSAKTMEYFRKMEVNGWVENRASSEDQSTSGGPVAGGSPVYQSLPSAGGPFYPMGFQAVPAHWGGGSMPLVPVAMSGMPAGYPMGPPGQATSLAGGSQFGPTGSNRVPGSNFRRIQELGDRDLRCTA